MSIGEPFGYIQMREGKNYNISFGDIQPGTISTRGPVLYQALVIAFICEYSTVTHLIVIA